MDFLILRPLPPKTGYHFFEGGWGGGWVGGGGGGGQKFLLNRLQAVRTHGACNTVSGPMVTQPLPDVQASVRTLVCQILVPPPAAAPKWKLGFEPPITRMPAGCVTTRPLPGFQRRASVLLGAVSATDKKPKLCVSV